MQITVTFDSLEEFNANFNRSLPAPTCEVYNRETGTWEPKEPEKKDEAQPEAPVEEPKKEKATKSTPKKEKAKDEAPAKTQVSITEVRQLLHKAIQENGKEKEAQQLLGEFGVKSLTELAEKYPEKLADFYAKAREAL